MQSHCGAQCQESGVDLEMGVEWEACLKNLRGPEDRLDKLNRGENSVGDSETLSLVAKPKQSEFEAS